MDELDRFLRKYKDDDYEFQSQDVAWGRRLIGTRVRGGGGKSSLTGILGTALGLTKKIMIGYFEDGNPDPDTFESFLKEAQKFYKEASSSGEVEAVLVLTPERLDRKPLAPLLKGVPKGFSEKLDYQVLPPSRGTLTSAKQAAGGEAPPPPEPSVLQTRLDYEAVNKALPSPSAHERALYAWEVLPERPQTPGQLFLVPTQERGILMTKVGPHFAPEMSFKWEACGEPQTEIDAGGPVLRLYDGSREHRLRTKDAQFIQVMIHHLKYAREGFISSHMAELGFDPELRERCQADFVSERYSLALRNAFTLLETRIRGESMAPRDKSGLELASYAFQPQNGKIPVGVTDSEREGAFQLFRGAFIAFRDPAAHNDQLAGMDRSSAFLQLALVDLLLKLTRRGKEQFQRGLP